MTMVHENRSPARSLADRSTRASGGLEKLWDAFDIGFWHPFGPYTGQSPTEVLDWKRSEVERHGWTFWSFVYSANTDAWLEQIKSTRGQVFALCSHSPGAADPDPYRGTLLASHYRHLDEGVWQSMPDPQVMKVTNPFKRGSLALAFKVRRIIPTAPVVPPFPVEWYSRRERTWRADPLPTRGEFLIRRGGNLRPRRVVALLELTEPYLAVLKSFIEGVQSNSRPAGKQPSDTTSSSN